MEVGEPGGDAATDSDAGSALTADLVEDPCHVHKHIDLLNQEDRAAACSRFY